MSARRGGQRHGQGGRERRGGEHIRLFVAVDLPEETRQGLAEWAAARAEELPALRLIPAGSLHVTLCFLGWRPAGEAGLVSRIALAVAAPVGEMEASAAIWLPPRGPRVLAVNLDDAEGRLGALQARVSEALAAEASYVPESRPFRPHVTVARVRRGERVRPRELPPPPGGRFTPPALTLYRSRLSRAGAEYEPLARAELA